MFEVELELMFDEEVVLDNNALIVVDLILSLFIFLNSMQQRQKQQQ